LHSFQSSSLINPQTGQPDVDNHALLEDFERIVTLLTEREPAPEIIYYSYRAGILWAAEKDPIAGWNDEQYGNGGEPIYGPDETISPPLTDHVAGLDWLLRDLRRTRPEVTIDLVGFGLGGVVTLVWALRQAEALATPGAGDTNNPIDAIERLVLLDSPVGGLNPRATSEASPEVLDLLRQRGLDVGGGQTIADLAADGGPLRELDQPLTGLTVASIENSRDYLVNGLPLPIPSPDSEWDGWIGKGARDIAIVPVDQQEVVDLGRADDQLLDAHRMILVSDSDTAREARERLVVLLVPLNA
jgi:pimeloyl-ACP methyl ester carboxylesterase